MFRARYLLIVIIPILLVTYTNCGQFKSVGELATILTSTCVSKIRATTKVAFASSVCSDISSFKCDRRVFKPGAVDEKTTKQECTRLTSGEEVCVNVTTYSFDTAGAREGASPGAFDEGGEYNREEYQCMNGLVLRQNVTVVSEDAVSLSEALSKAISSCHEKGVK
jgi:hypothetical protein